MQKFGYIILLYFGLFIVATNSSVVRQSVNSPSPASGSILPTREEKHLEDTSWRLRLTQMKTNEQPHEDVENVNVHKDKVGDSDSSVKSSSRFLWNFLRIPFAPEAVSSSEKDSEVKPQESILHADENPGKETSATAPVEKGTSETEILDKQNPEENSEEHLVKETISDGIQVISTEPVGGSQEIKATAENSIVNNEESIVRIVRDEDKTSMSTIRHIKNSENEGVLKTVAGENKNAQSENTTSENENSKIETDENDNSKTSASNSEPAENENSDIESSKSETAEINNPDNSVKNVDNESITGTMENLQAESIENLSSGNKAVSTGDADVVMESNSAIKEQDEEGKEYVKTKNVDGEAKELERKSCVCTLLKNNTTNSKLACLRFCDDTKMESQSELCELNTPEGQEPFCTAKTAKPLEEDTVINPPCTSSNSSTPIASNQENKLEEKRCYNLCPNRTAEFDCLYVNGVTWKTATLSGVIGDDYECRMVHKGTENGFLPEGGCASFCENLNKSETLGKYQYTCEEKNEICNGWLPFTTKPCNFYCVLTTVDITTICSNEN